MPRHTSSPLRGGLDVTTVYRGRRGFLCAPHVTPAAAEGPSTAVQSSRARTRQPRERRPCEQGPTLANSAPPCVLPGAGYPFLERASVARQGRAKGHAHAVPPRRGPCPTESCDHWITSPRLTAKTRRGNHDDHPVPALVAPRRWLTQSSQVLERLTHVRRWSRGGAEATFVGLKRLCVLGESLDVELLGVLPQLS
jgi:hypothetical protein